MQLPIAYKIVNQNETKKLLEKEKGTLMGLLKESYKFKLKK